MVGLIDVLPDPHELYKNLPWPELEVVSRQEWGALPPTSVQEFKSFPIKQVVLGYTETEICEDKESCIKMMQELQRKHMAEGLSDIRFNYVVGWDQRVYEGRGFCNVPGKHPRYPHLEGENVEVVLSGQRGALPLGLKSSIMYILVDKYSFDDGPISFEEAIYHLDYEDYEQDPREEQQLREAREVSEIADKLLAPYVKDVHEHWARRAKARGNKSF